MQMKPHKALFLFLFLFTTTMMVYAQQTTAVGFETKVGPTWKSCGKFDWDVRLFITDSSGQTVKPLTRSAESWIIQHVVRKIDVKNCDNTKVEEDAKNDDYYEAWRVGLDGRVKPKYEYDFGDGFELPIDMSKKDADDFWFQRGRSETYGSWTLEGWAYTKDSIAPKEFEPDAVIGARPLPATRTKPPGLGDWTLYRHAEASWDCCTNKKTKPGQATAENKWGTYKESWTSDNEHEKTVDGKKVSRLFPTNGLKNLIAGLLSLSGMAVNLTTL
jgi:hypothetical protein